MHHSNPELSEADIARGHDERDASARGVLIFVIIFLASLVAVQAVAWRVLKWIDSREDAINAVDHPQHPLRNLMTSNPPEPRLEPEPSHNLLPHEDLLAVQQRERSLLNSGGWIDSKHQFARIPLNEATDLAIERGLPLTLPAIGAATQQSTPLASSTHGPGGIP